VSFYTCLFSIYIEFVRGDIPFDFLLYYLHIQFIIIIIIQKCIIIIIILAKLKVHINICISYSTLLFFVQVSVVIFGTVIFWHITWVIFSVTDSMRGFGGFSLNFAFWQNIKNKKSQNKKSQWTIL